MNTQPPQVQRPSERRRVFLWVFLAIQVVFFGWVIYAGVSAPRSGPSPGVGLQIGLWALTDVITGVAYLICQLPRGSR
jgi:hypothetical protein